MRVGVGWVALTLVVAGAMAGLAGPRPAAAEEGPPPRIELWTMGQGESLFERFGHGVFCVFPGDVPAGDADGRCYNYGTTDFRDATEVVSKFLRKEARFWVSIMSASRTLEVYRELDRDIFVQELPLAPAQARALAARLEHDMRPENRFYTYDHFRDNCTTRLRDHLDAVTGGAFRAGTDASYGPSFRDMVRDGFSADLGLAILTELLPARSTDARPTWWQAMFHPDALRAMVWARYGVEPVQINARSGRPLTVSPARGRAAIAWIALGLAAAVGFLVVSPRRRVRRAGLVVLGVALFAVSLPIWTLVVGSKIPDLTANEAAFLAVPFDLALCFLSGRGLLAYLSLRLGMVGVGLVASLAGLLVQPLGPLIVLVGLPLAAARVALVPKKTA